jgi:hypothetical protein
MALKFTNNAFGTLASSINNSVTTISLTAGNGARFPTLGTGDFFFATLIDASSNLEIVRVTARSTDTLTVVRGQDGTTARSYAAGDRIELRPTAGAMNEFVQVTDTQTIAGNKTFTGNNTHSGTNTFTNTIVGSINGNAATVTNGVYTTGTQTIDGNKTFLATTFFQDANHYIALSSGNAQHILDSTDYWNFARSTNVLTWIVGGVTRATFSATGDLTMQGNVTAYSDQRLKSDIKTIEDGLSTVKRLRGVSFTKEGKSGIGVIAQEVQQIVPQVVMENSDGYLSVAYGNLVGVLIEAVKELSAKVEALEAK